MATQSQELFQATHCPPPENLYAALMGAGREHSHTADFLNFPYRGQEDSRSPIRGILNEVLMVVVRGKIFRRFRLYGGHREWECWHSAESRRAMLRHGEGYDLGLLPMLIYLEGFVVSGGSFKVIPGHESSPRSMAQALEISTLRTADKMTQGALFAPKTTIADPESFLSYLIRVAEQAPQTFTDDWWWQIACAIRFGSERLLSKTLKEASAGTWMATVAEDWDNDDRPVDFRNLGWNFCKGYAQVLANLSQRKTPARSSEDVLGVETVVAMAMFSAPPSPLATSMDGAERRQVQLLLWPTINSQCDNPVVKNWENKLRQCGEFPEGIDRA